MARRRRWTFRAEFKADAVRLVREGMRSVQQVAAEFDLTETSLREWVSRAGIEAGRGPSDALTTAERAELAQLRRDVKRLEGESSLPRREIICELRVGPLPHRAALR